MWFTSDNHFFHKNIQKFCPDTRPGNDVYDMNRLMIQAHNDVVGSNDDVYFLGDFSFGTADETRSVISQLNGKKHLIYGNHDKVIKNNYDIQKMFDSVDNYLEIKYSKRMLCLFHFPMMEWNRMQHGSYHLFGHVHGNHINSPRGRSMDVGIDTRPTGDMRPWHIDEIDQILCNREIISHHGD